MPGFLRASVFFVAVTAVVLGTVVDSALSEVNTKQVEALWQDYVVAKKRFQHDLAKLIGDEWPELQRVADLQRDQQFAMIELRNMKFQYLLAHDPGRIVYDRGLSQFANFEWTEADSEALRKHNPDFLKLERWAELNSKRLSEHPDLLAARERLTTLERHEHYQSMMERFEARMDDLESALNTIDRARKRADRTKVLKSQIGQ